MQKVAICKECGQEMNPHGLIDLNIKELEEQYQKTYGNKQFKTGQKIVLFFFICENILKQNNIIFIIKMLHCA